MGSVESAFKMWASASVGGALKARPFLRVYAKTNASGSRCC
jgi:hypothetical protein